MSPRFPAPLRALWRGKPWVSPLESAAPALKRLVPAVAVAQSVVRRGPWTCAVCCRAYGVDAMDEFGRIVRVGPDILDYADFDQFVRAMMNLTFCGRCGVAMHRSCATTMARGSDRRRRRRPKYLSVLFCPGCRS